jgi:hypothetical protein
MAIGLNGEEEKWREICDDQKMRTSCSKKFIKIVSKILILKINLQKCPSPDIF